MLLVVGHPGIGSALETLLRIEDRYEVRRVQGLADTGAALGGWTPDIALVDGVLLGTGRREDLAVPTIVLSGNLADGKRLSSRLAQGRGWLRKDASAKDLREALDRALPKGVARAPRRLISFIVATVVLIVVVAILATALLRTQG